MARPRKNGARAKSGRLSRAFRGPARDHGTPEVQRKRLMLVGYDADPVLAATPLGCIFARGYLGDLKDDREAERAKDRYEAGLEFGKLHAALYQRWRSAIGPQASDDRLADLQRRFNAMVEWLNDRQRSVLTNVCAFGYWPIWFDCDRIGLHRLPEDDADQEHLISGLDVLASAPTKPKILTREREIA